MLLFLKIMMAWVIDYFQWVIDPFLCGSLKGEECIRTTQTQLTDWKKTDRGGNQENSNDMEKIVSSFNVTKGGTYFFFNFYIYMNCSVTLATYKIFFHIIYSSNYSSN